MSQVYPKFLYARVVNPHNINEYLLTGSEPADVSDTRVGDNDVVSLIAARYALVGTGTIQHTAPAYVEDTTH